MDLGDNRIACGHRHLFYSGRESARYASEKDHPVDGFNM